MLATFRSLRHRNFRTLWLGLVLSASGSWLQLVGQSLLVLRLSDGSALALGAVSLAQGWLFLSSCWRAACWPTASNRAASCW